MAGIYNRSTQDACWEKQEDNRNQKIYDYNLYRNSVMRPNTLEAPFLSDGRQPDFYGPLTGARVTRESFMQGRGHCINKCPDCQVVYLPDSLFPTNTVKKTCERVDLQSMYTRLPRSCNGLNETIITPYHQMPENYKKGYQGYNAVVQTQLHTRMGPPQDPKPLSECAQNYGSYAKNPFFNRYA